MQRNSQNHGSMDRAPAAAALDGAAAGDESLAKARRIEVSVRVKPKTPGSAKASEDTYFKIQVCLRVSVRVSAYVYVGGWVGVWVCVSECECECVSVCVHNPLMSLVKDVCSSKGSFFALRLLPSRGPGTGVRKPARMGRAGFVLPRFSLWTSFCYR
jgi:hypothetical protein